MGYMKDPDVRIRGVGAIAAIDAKSPRRRALLARRNRMTNARDRAVSKLALGAVRAGTTTGAGTGWGLPPAQKHVPMGVRAGIRAPMPGTRLSLNFPAGGGSSGGGMVTVPGGQGPYGGGTGPTGPVGQPPPPPTCFVGYTFDPTTGACIPTSPAPPAPGDGSTTPSDGGGGGGGDTSGGGAASSASPGGGGGGGGDFYSPPNDDSSMPGPSTATAPAPTLPAGPVETGMSTGTKLALVAGGVGLLYLLFKDD